jgi:CheY-like chemotaxis protein
MVSFNLLLADDSITIQKVVELILADEDCEIRSANNGEEALSLLTSFHPDIILADTDMPAIDGYALCERIKQEPAMNAIPVILLTGAFEPLDEERARQVRADDYLIKPFEAQELIQKINEALAGKAFPVESEVPSEASPLYPGQLPADDEIWDNVEETPETVPATPLTGEEEAGASTEELISIAEEAEHEVSPGAEMVHEPVSEEIPPAEKTTGLPAMELLSRDELRELFEKSFRERLSALLSSADLKETLIASITPFMKDSVDKILWDLTPELIERMLKEILKGSIESLTTEVQKVIWETVPELAETMISQEIERIRSEF